jgi:thiamine kinase-like enzyme
MPTDVVVRMPVVLPPSFPASSQTARQQRELDAVAWLADHGAPVVRPSPRMPRRPVRRDGLSMTFWELVDVDPDAKTDYVAHTDLVPSLHAALRELPGELPFLSPVAITVPAGLAFLEANPEWIAPADLDRAQREWDAVAGVLSSREAFEAAFPRATVQPIHGDAPAYNLIQTRTGPLYADFEDVTLGPIEWDLALQGSESVAIYDAAAKRAGMRRVDPEAQRLMDVARCLQIVASLALVPELPVLATGLAPVLETWRSLPFAGGLRF